MACLFEWTQVDLTIESCVEASGDAPGLFMLTINIHGQTDLELEIEDQLSWASCHPHFNLS